MEKRKRVIACALGIALLWAVLAVLSASPAAAQSLGALEGKRVVMIIADQGFRDEEFREPRALLDRHGAMVTVASASGEKSKGMLGMEVEPDVRLASVKAADYDAVVFIGGIGARSYWDDPTALALARDAGNSGKVVGAICIAPVILANAGLLKGKRATVWSSERGRLRKAGAKVSEADVEVDGRVITASGPSAAEAFGRALVRALKGR